MSVIDRAHRLVLILVVTAIPAVYLIDSVAEVVRGEFRLSRGMEFYVAIVGVAGYQIAKKKWQADWILVAVGAGTAVMALLGYSGDVMLMDLTTAAILVPIFGLAIIVISRRARLFIGGSLCAAAVGLAALAMHESGLRLDDVVTKSVAIAFSFSMTGWLLYRLRSAYEEQYEARERFVASVSHELRTPLTALVGFAELLSDDGPDAEAVALIRGQAQEAAGIVEDLLVAARVESGQVAVSISTTEVASESEGVLEAQATTDKSIRSKMTPLHVEADPLRFRQILRNLVTNAIRHGGDNITVRTFSEGRLGHIEVCDDGSGFNAEDAETIFAAYGRAKNTDLRTGSIGLGLTVSRQLARLMDGDLVATRQDGLTVFRLSLPLSTQVAPESAVPV